MKVNLAHLSKPKWYAQTIDELKLILFTFQTEGHNITQVEKLLRSIEHFSENVIIAFNETLYNTRQVNITRKNFSE